MSNLSKVVAGMTPAALRQWLEANHETHTFHSCDSSLCPLAGYLSELLGRPVDVVDVEGGPDYEAFTFLSETVALPVWANRFASGIDRFADGAPISCGDALNVLNKVTL